MNFMKIELSQIENLNFPICLDQKEGGKNSPEWIQVLKTGTFQYYGELLTFTKDHFDKMIENFNLKTIGHDCQINYSHNSHEKAAGWVKQLEVREDNQLWAKIKWTKSGAEAVLDQEYRYLSSEIHFNFKDNESGEEKGMCFLGAALTNIPFIRRMEPTSNLSQKGENMNLEELKKMLSEANEKAASLSQEKETLEAQVKEFQEKKLDEKIATLSQENESLKEENEKLKEEARISDLQAKFDSMLKEGKAVEAQREAWMKQDLAEFAKNSSSVNLSAKGSSEDQGLSNLSNEDKLLHFANQIKKEKKVSFSEALEIAMDENPELVESSEEDLEND